MQLVKNQDIRLVKPNGSTLTRIRMRLGWSPAGSAPARRGLLGRLAAAAGAGSIDLDASCIMFDAQSRQVDVVWFQHLRSKDRSVQHSGDDLTGRGGGESIIVDLLEVPSSIQSLVFVVNSYSGQDFGNVANASCNLTDLSSKPEIDLGTYDLSVQGSNNAVVMAKVVRDGNGWTATMIGEMGRAGRTYESLVPLAQAQL